MADLIKTYETLERQAKQAVEDKQKEIAELNRVIAAMIARRKELQDQIAQEEASAFAAADPQLMRQAELFKKKAGVELREIAEAMAQAEKIADQKHDELKDLYAEHKRFELMLDRRLLERKKRLQKKEQAMLDEVAGMRHK